MSSLKRSSVSEPAPRKKTRFDDDEEEEEEPARPTEVEAVPPTETTIAHEDARTLAEALLQGCPLITDEDIQTIPDFNGKIIVQGDDKAEACRLFDESDEIKTLDRLDPGQQVQWYFKTFYKTFVRVFRSSPFILLSPLNNLRYGPRRSAKTCHAAFSTTFSEHMAPLLVHPVWRQNYKLLRAALQFTVLCRMQSRCPWPLTNDTLGYQALAKLRQTCRAFDRTPVDIAGMLRQAIDETPVAEEFPSFLVSIAGHVKKGEEKGIEIGGQIALPVEVKDLKSIKAAIDSFQWGNASWRGGTKRIWDVFMTERGGPQSEYPKDGELKDSIQAGMRFLCQKIVIARSDTLRRNRQAEAGTITGRPDPVVDHEIKVEPTVTEDIETRDAGPEGNVAGSIVPLAEIDMRDRSIDLTHIDSPDSGMSELELDHSMDQDDELVIRASPNTNHMDLWDSLDRVRLNPTSSTSLQKSNPITSSGQGPTPLQSISHHQTDLSGREDTLAIRLDERLDTLEKLVKNVDSNVGSLRTNNYGFEGLRAENERLQEEQLEASALEDRLRAEIADLKRSLAEKTSLETDNTRLRDEIQTLKTQLHQVRTESAEAIVSQNQNLSQANDKIRTLESAVQELQASVKEIQGKSGRSKP